MSVDPLADLYYSWSPYNYVLGNPISFIDPDGRIVEDPDGNIIFTETGTRDNWAFFSGSTDNGKTHTVITFDVTLGKVLTDNGGELDAYIATSEPRVTVYDLSNGDIIKNEPLNQATDCSTNCIGVALAEGKVNIASGYVTDELLASDNYTKLKEGENASTGDIGVYRDKTNNTTHAEKYMSNEAVTTKGGIDVGTNDGVPGKNPNFSNSSYSVWKKRNPSTTSNIPSGGSSNVQNGVNTVDEKTFNVVKGNVSN